MTIRTGLLRFIGRLTMILMLSATFALAACDDEGGDNNNMLLALMALMSGGRPDPFAEAVNTGDVVPIEAGAAEFNMVYTSSAAGIVFPSGNVDAGTATLLRRFFMGDTEVTNALAAEVFQWAYDRGRFSDNPANPNGVDSTTAKRGGQQLIDLSDSWCRIHYTDGSFTIETGYENFPVIDVTWYGAIMLCNWLTEMQDHSTRNVVYTGITDSWDHADTIVNPSKTGYRLPTSVEWEFAARYIGDTAPAIEDLASDCVYYNKGGEFLSLTDGYYWTPYDYASGAIKDYVTDPVAVDAVAWTVNNSGDTPPVDWHLRGAALLAPNQLGIYDMSGNVREWCVDRNGNERYMHNSGFHESAGMASVSIKDDLPPSTAYFAIGLRLAKTMRTDGDVAVNGITLNKTATSITSGDDEQLTATLTPAGASFQNVFWSSNDNAVADVSGSGLVQANNPGTATITATAEDGGLTATCVVTVLNNFSAASAAGQLFTVPAGSVSFDMIYANDQASITFPVGNGDSGTSTLTRQFFMGGTEVTNALAAEVFQWAYDHGRFSDTVGDPNGIDSATAKHGGQELIDLVDSWCGIDYAGGVFSVDTGYENHPVIDVTWYGAIMLCNWLTEMQDNGTDNLVYTGIDASWDHTETIADPSQTGYRLPSNDEWEFAARYIGATAPVVGDLASDCVYYNKGGEFLTLTEGYYWTPGHYASGATDDTDNTAAVDAVAWTVNNSGDDPPNDWHLRGVALLTPNQLGICDMSGNAKEWCFDAFGSNRYLQYSSFHDSTGYARLTMKTDLAPTTAYFSIGMRLAKTQ